MLRTEDSFYFYS